MKTTAIRSFTEAEKLDILTILVATTVDHHWSIWLICLDPRTRRRQRLLIGQDEPDAVYEYSDGLTFETAKALGLTLGMTPEEEQQARLRGHLVASDISHPGLLALIEEIDYRLEESAQERIKEELGRMDGLTWDIKTALA